MGRTSRSQGQRVTEANQGRGSLLLAIALALAGVPWGVFTAPASPPEREHSTQGADLRLFLGRVKAETQRGDQILLILPGESAADGTALYRARYLLTGRHLHVQSVDNPDNNRIDPDWVAAWRAPLPSPSGPVVYRDANATLSKGLR